MINVSKNATDLTAATYAVIAAAAVFAKFLEAGQTPRVRVVFEQINTMVIAWGGYAAAATWLASAAGSPIPLVYKLIILAIIVFGLYVSLVAVERYIELQKRNPVVEDKCPHQDKPSGGPHELED